MGHFQVQSFHFIHEEPREAESLARVKVKDRARLESPSLRVQASALYSHLLSQQPFMKCLLWTRKCGGSLL